MELSLLLVLALAVWQTVDILHHSQICYPLRRSIDRYGEQGPLPHFFAALFGCPYCLSFWVAIIYAAGMLYGLSLPGWLVISSVAAMKLANLGYDIAKRFDMHPPRYEPDAIKVTDDNTYSTPGASEADPGHEANHGSLPRPGSGGSESDSAEAGGSGDPDPSPAA